MEPSKPSRGNSNRLLWVNWVGPLLLLGLFLAFIHALVNSTRRQDLAYSEFKQMLRDGVIQSSNLKELSLGPARINGELNAEAKTKKGNAFTKFRVARLGVQLDDSLLPLLEEKGISYDAEFEPNQLVEALLWFVPMFALLVIFSILIFKRLGAGGSAMAFGRSRAKLYAQEDLNISFDDVAGIDEAVEELREVVDFLKTPEKYQAVGGRIPKGVLLVGPPGTGKTLLAKAVAGEADTAFFGLSGSDFVEMFVGVGAARVRDLFAQAEQRAPCIIFIDELDALGKTRGSGYVGGHDEREQTLNQLLVEMDGFDSNRGVIIMAATNRPETLDAALLRPGRFDRTVVVDRPDVKGREAILKVHIRSVKVSEALDLRAIAALTPGFVGADLANLVNEAALLAAREGKTHADKHNFEEAIERVMAGLERKQRVMLPEEKRRIAYHECGHAIVAYLLPGADPVHKISIIPRGVGALGYTLQRPLEDRYLATKTELEHRICTLLGGITAEELIFPDTSTGAQNDLKRATVIARKMVKEFGMSERLGRINYMEQDDAAFLGPGAPSIREHSEATAAEIDQEVKRIMDTLGQEAREILSAHAEVLERLTERLLDRETIDANELTEVMNASSPRIVPGTARRTSRTPAIRLASPTQEPEAVDGT